MFEKHGAILRILPDGTSTLTETVNATAKATLNMRKYPFDTQNLEIVFQFLGVNNKEVAFEADNSLVKNPQIKLSQWTVKQIKSFSAEMPQPGILRDVSTFNVDVEVSRKSFFMVRLVILPLIVMVMLSWSVFWMERSSLGDRINISFIGILTAVAYQNVVSSLSPHISYVTLMMGMVNISYLTMCASVVVNLVVGAYEQKGMVKFGELIDIRCRWLFPTVYFGLLVLITLISFAIF
jgi:hypothetical protein